MAWKECSPVQERMKFVIRLETGERMRDLCLEFGITPKTGYKIWNRYKGEGLTGLVDRSRRPHRFARQTSPKIQKLILDLKREHTTWGASKLREVLQKNHPHLQFPVRGAIHSLLDKNGLVKKRKQRRGRSFYPTHLTQGGQPNDVWATDYKGQFRMQNSQYCYPLTVTDDLSRYILGCEALEDTKGSSAKEIFTDVFREYGLPIVIRSDNGTPFASRALLGLSKLSVWWLRLGIRVEHTEPAHPQQNGRHERMHLTLKQDVKPAKNLLQQQEHFDHFKEIFNNKRPHEALRMKCPGEIYRPSQRVLPEDLDPLEYPECGRVLRVSTSGGVHFSGKKNYFFLSEVLAGENIGITEEDEGLWRVKFMNIDLGFLDGTTLKFSPAQELIYQE
jgi:transposase InsO family protein